MAKVWVTRYALTDGIMEMKGEIHDDGYFLPDGDGYWSSIPKKDWHHTKAEAIARAEEMRIERLKSLDNQIKKISSLKFE